VFDVYEVDRCSYHCINSSPHCCRRAYHRSVHHQQKIEQNLVADLFTFHPSPQRYRLPKDDEKKISFLILVDSCWPSLTLFISNVFDLLAQLALVVIVFVEESR
jgi:hypothetical protein